MHSSYPLVLPFGTPSDATSQLSEFHLGVSWPLSRPTIAFHGRISPRRPSKRRFQSISGLQRLCRPNVIHGDTHESHRYRAHASARWGSRGGSMPPLGLAPASAPQREALQRCCRRARRRAARLELPGRLRPDHRPDSASTTTKAAGAIRRISIAFLQAYAAEKAKIEARKKGY